MHDPGIDALLPQEIAERAESSGVRKMRSDTTTLFVLGVLGGAFIALGAMFATTVLAGADGAVPFGIGRLLAGVAFSLGLILVVLGGAELFTGNALMVMALAAGKIRMAEMLRAWAIVYAGNFVGATGTALLVFLSGQYRLGDGGVAAVALDLAARKAMLGAVEAFFLAILCNVLVCLAVWLSLGARSTADKVVAMVFPVSAFVAAGFEHSVANMYIMPLGLLIKSFAPETLLAALGPASVALPHLTVTAFLTNLVIVTAGNIVGGGVLVGAVYWFVYLRTRPR